jgi:hypothetical protein
VGTHNERLFQGFHADSGCGGGTAGRECRARQRAIVLRPDNTSDFEALRSRQGQVEAILVAYDIMEANGAGRAP